MTARELYITHWVDGEVSSARLWSIATSPTDSSPLSRMIRLDIRGWWNDLSEHEKIAVTRIPLALLDEASHDWKTTAERL